MQSRHKILCGSIYLGGARFLGTLMKKEHNPIVRLIKLEKAGKRSLRASIDAMCAHCMGCTSNSVESGFRREIRGCTAYNCPLHNVRPL